MEESLKKGYHRVKCKIGPGHDIQYLSAVRKQFGDIMLMADANSAYTLDDIPVFKEIDDLHLLMIEQPLADNDIVDHRHLQAAIKTPICLDESIDSLEDARRAIEPLLVPPGAETLYEVHKRVLPALFRCLEESEGDIAVVVHASVMQAILAELCGIPLEESRGLRPPYCGVAVLEADETLRLQALPLAPCPPLTPLLAEQLLLAAAPGERVTAHCRTVASESMRIAEALPLPLDRELLVSAALLHDVARGEPHHAALGAAWLNELGYSEAAALIAQHHDLKTDALDEAAILYLADKCIREDLRVSVEERFRDSAVRCRTDEGCAAHARRYAQAQTIRQRINSLCGYELVE